MRTDFHTHTSASKDSLTSPADLVRIAHLRGLDRIVVTDHNRIDGALICRALDPQLVIVGEEIMTTRGEILAAYVTTEIPAGLSPQETIQRLRDQGAFISVSHPFDSWRSGAWRLGDLVEISPLVDAIEIFNARCLFVGENHRSQEFARQHDLPGTAGSDAHAAFEVGAACLLTPEFRDADGLRRIIREGRVEGRLSPFWVHFASRIARFRKQVGA